MPKEQYSKEEIQKLFKTHVDKIDFTKCPKIRKITTRTQFDNASSKVLRALWLQFNYDIEEEHDKMPYIGDFTMTTQAKEEFETYYKVFFKSKQFEAVSWDYTLNCEPNIIE